MVPALVGHPGRSENSTNFKAKSVSFLAALTFTSIVSFDSIRLSDAQLALPRNMLRKQRLWIEAVSCQVSDRL
jgi:hypothetical protein